MLFCYSFTRIAIRPSHKQWWSFASRELTCPSLNHTAQVAGAQLQAVDDHAPWLWNSPSPYCFQSVDSLSSSLLCGKDEGSRLIQVGLPLLAVCWITGDWSWEALCMSRDIPITRTHLMLHIHICTHMHLWSILLKTKGKLHIFKIDKGIIP